MKVLHRLAFLCVTLICSFPFFLHHCWRKCAKQNCQLSGWSSWSECTQMCGEHGGMTRYRQVNSPATCAGTCEHDLAETKACNRFICTALDKHNRKQVICNDETTEIQCPVDYKIQITSSNFGCTLKNSCHHVQVKGYVHTTNGLDKKTKEKIKAMCNDRRRCNVRALGGETENSCNGTYEYLVVIYRCMADPLGYVVRVYAPLIYMHSEETFRPSDIDFFLEGVKMMDSNGREVCRKKPLTAHNLCEGNRNYLLTTKKALASASATNPTVLKGILRDDVKIYSIVKTKGNYIDVFYWTFYPYNKGKEICIPFASRWGCIGQSRIFGNHVGDWEHFSIRFTRHLQPHQAYTSRHHYCDKRYNFNWNKRLFINGDHIGVNGTHPVLYSSLGSHGLWTRPGCYVYKEIGPIELTDYTNKGHMWRTWANLEIIRWGQWTGEASFLNFKGRWGNRKRDCGMISEKLSGECTLSDAPRGPSFSRMMDKDLL